MKTYFTIIILSLSAFSCKSQSNKQELNSILKTYKAVKLKNSNLENLDNKIYNLREKVIQSNDSSILFSLDSILLDGTTANQYQQTLIDLDTLDQVPLNIRKCKTIDSAPSDAVRVKSNSLRLPNDSIKISVVFHIIQATHGKGHLSNEALVRQMNVLNSGFSNTLFSFVLKSVDSIKNDRWYKFVDQHTQEERDMHNTLSVDPERNLNVYFVGNEGYFGYANFPWNDRKDFDGVVIFNETIPGGAKQNFNEGKTLTHEVGHYLGLWHTFHKGCGVGDDVNDTPEEAIATDGCPIGKDTCPASGPDPITNYMDYSFDLCMKEFTPGQNSRMNWAVRRFRKNLFKIPL